MVTTTLSQAFKRTAAAVTLSAVMMSLAGLAPSLADAAATGREDPAGMFRVVDCMLPPRVINMGRRFTTQEGPRAARVTVGMCEAQGGKYAYDRADYATSWQIWLPFANAGDPQAQHYLGELAEKGAFGAPDYVQAADWYGRAAEQGFAASQIALAQLYEQGQGVPQDAAYAVSLYQQAFGVDGGLVQVAAFDAEGTNSLAARYATQSIEIAERDARVMRLETDLTLLEDELRQVLARSDNSDTELASAQAAVEAERRALADERAALEASQASLQAQSDARAATEAELAALRLEVRTNADELAAARAALTDRTDSLAAKELELAEAEAALEDARQSSTAQASVAEREAVAAQVRAELEAEREALDAGREMLALQQGDQTQREDDLRAQEAELAEAALLLDSKQAALDARERAVAEREDSLDQEMAQASAEQEGAAIIAQERSRLEEALSMMRDELAALETRTTEYMEFLDQPPQIQMIDPPIGQTRDAVVDTPANASVRVIMGRVATPRGLSELRVNEQTVSLEDDSVFRVEIPIGEDLTRVDVVAEDEAGDTDQLAFYLRPSDSASPEDREAVQPLLVNLAPDIDFGEYHALLIGNQNYENLPRLRTPHNDVNEIARILQERYGFKTTVVLDASRYEILSALNDLRRELDQDDNLLVYYAGHGELDTTNDRGHWQPVDAEADNTANWISNLELTDQFNIMTVRKLLVVADSCYSGSLTRSALGELAAGQNEEAQLALLRATAQKRSRTALTSGGLAPVLDGGGRGQFSVFARALIDVLIRNRDIAEGKNIHNLIAAEVAMHSGQMRQVPEYAPIKFAGHEAGDFLFVPRI